MKRFGFLLAGLVAAAGLALASAFPAGASVTSVQYSKYLAGYAGGLNGQQTFAAIEDQVTAPDEPASVAADAVAVGIVLQNEVNSPATPTLGEALVWNDTSHRVPARTADSSPTSGRWSTARLSARAVSRSRRLTSSPITDSSGDLICVPAGQQEYQEIYYSTKLHLINFFAGRREPGYVAYQIHLPPFFSTQFYEFGIGVDTTDGVTASSLQPGTLADFTRCGLTSLSSHAVGAHASPRIDLSGRDLVRYIGTQDGTSSGAVTLLPPAQVQAGQQFTVSAVS